MVALAHESRDVGDVEDAWNAYQQSRFGYVIHRLVNLIPGFKVAAYTYTGADRMLAFGRLALLSHVAASTLTKLGEPDLAWTASDRGVEAARHSENPVVIGSLLRSVAHSLLSTGDYAEAIRLTRDAADFYQPHLTKPSPTMLSVYGTHLLAGSMAAARHDDRATAREFLDEASDAARRLGHDSNRLWTAFGPANVDIHRVSTAMELGDGQVALDLGPSLDTSAVPTERRARHALEVSRALSSTNKRQEALATLLEAEQLAPEQVTYHFLSRNLVQTWIRSAASRVTNSHNSLSASTWPSDPGRSALGT